jgi:hypothetical protein
VTRDLRPTWSNATSQTAKRHAEGVGLDGDAQRQATVFRL